MWGDPRVTLSVCDRDGLSSRNHLFGGGDQVQVNMEGEFDMDQEIDGLRSQVGRLKEVGGNNTPATLFTWVMPWFWRFVFNQHFKQA